MKSWTYGIMTDLWGDIPYSKANTGDVASPPTYDTQKDIYSGLFADVKQASDLAGTTGAIAGATSAYGAADLIYAGDMAKWKRFANSLRLRYGLRLSRVDPATAQAQVASAVTRCSSASGGTSRNRTKLNLHERSRTRVLM